MGRKKNKKSFSGNLELLFQERLEENDAREEILMPRQESPAAAPKSDPPKSTRAKKPKAKAKSKSKRKSFSSNLERFFKDNIEGLLDDVLDSDVADTKRQLLDQEKSQRKPVGLDLLIKRTTEAVPEAQPKSNKTTKRVTVVLDAKKLDALKRIAKEEKRRLQQIIGELVNDYLRESNAG